MMPSCVEKPAPINGDDIDRVLCGSYSSESNLNACLVDAEACSCCSSTTSTMKTVVGGESCSCSSTSFPSQKQDGQIIPTEQPTPIVKRQLSNSLLPRPNFQLLPGEELDSENAVEMSNCKLFLTNYRILIDYHGKNAACAIPLTAVESLEAKDITGLNIACKDGLIIKLRAENSESAITWYKKLTQKTCIMRNLEGLFAFRFFSAISKDRSRCPRWLRLDTPKNSIQEDSQIDPAYEKLYREFKQLRLSESAWRISSVNKRFELCSTYPQYLIVPGSVTDDELKVMRFGRFHCRIPTLVWRNKKNGAVLLRSSQPNLAFFGMMTNENDVKLYEKIKSAANTTEQISKFLIVDARSYTAAWANRAKSGGFETSDTYSNAEIVFMGLPNIHNIRYSFHQLRQLLNSGLDNPTYLQALQSTLWLQNIGQLFSAVERCLNALCKEGISVLVHCSDGWDRTTQIISLCMIIADPMYRTFDGFQTLVQRQWIEFGHKFADRNSVLNGDENEKSPVFLQWLDCVFQLWEKNSDSFQFNRRYLMKLVQHTYSGLFGSFLFNSIKEASDFGCISHANEHLADNNSSVLGDRPAPLVFSIWDYLGKHNNEEFFNPAYNRDQRRQLVFPKHLPELILWRDAYCNLTICNLTNNTDDCGVVSNGVHDLSLGDKSSSTTNTYSRSQSASSLTSLDQNTSHHSFHSFLAHLNNNHSVQQNSVQNSHATKFSEACNGLATNNNLKLLDADGLSCVPVTFEERIIERLRDHHHRELQKNKTSPLNSSLGSHSHRDLNGLSRPFEGKTGRTRNESVDSTGFEIIAASNGNLECCRQKHNSSSTASVSSILPSSYSSTCTTISEVCPPPPTMITSTSTTSSTTVNGT